jgi:hypothetical protein
MQLLSNGFIGCMQVKELTSCVDHNPIGDLSPGLTADRDNHVFRCHEKTLALDQSVLGEILLILGYPRIIR